MKAYESVGVCWFKKGEEKERKEKKAALQAAVRLIQSFWETVDESPVLLVTLLTVVWTAKFVVNMQQFEMTDVSFLHSCWHVFRIYIEMTQFAAVTL